MQKTMIELTHWAVMERPDGSRHIIAGGEGQKRCLTTKIQEFFPATQQVKTWGDYTYQLVGPPSPSPDGTWELGQRWDGRDRRGNGTWPEEGYRCKGDTPSP